MHEVVGNYFSFLKKSRKGRLIMIPIEKTVKMTNQDSFRIPSHSREELKFKQGNIAKIHIRNNAILINACHVYTPEVSSAIGDGGQIYIPIEVRNHFRLKGIVRFKVFIDEVNKCVILRPFE